MDEYSVVGEAAGICERLEAAAWSRVLERANGAALREAWGEWRAAQKASGAPDESDACVAEVARLYGCGR